MAQRNQALYSYEKTVRSAFKEVNDSLDAISRYGEQLSSFRNKRPLPRKPYVLHKTATVTATLLIWMCLMPSERCSPPSLAGCR